MQICEILLQNCTFCHRVASSCCEVTRFLAESEVCCEVGRFVAKLHVVLRGWKVVVAKLHVSLQCVKIFSENCEFCHEVERFDAKPQCYCEFRCKIESFRCEIQVLLHRSGLLAGVGAELFEKKRRAIIFLPPHGSAG